LLFFVFFLFVAYYFCGKYIGFRFALLFTALLAFSPLNLAMARRALTDSAANFFMILSICLFWNYLKSRSKARVVCFILAYSLAVLFKESAALLTLVFSAYLILNKIILKNKIYAQDILVISAIPFILVYSVYLLLECSPYLTTIFRVILNSPKTNPYAIFYGSGPWFRYLVDYMLLSPWIVILSIGFLLYSLLERNKDPLTLYFISIFLFSFMLFNLFTKNVRYVMLLDMPIRLFSCLMIEKLSRKIFPRNRKALIIMWILVSAISLFDYLSFRGLFINNAIYDPASFFLLKARQFIP
jgi:4-amino-4-deoxy-L-arabinose transferase-like glycosyltransferase